MPQRQLTMIELRNNLAPLFDGLEACSLLELGPHDGSWITPAFADRVGKLAFIELDSVAVQTLRELYPTARVMSADYHTAVQNIGQFDAVAMFSVLNHTHSPLGLLEDVVNYVKPRHILLDCEPGAGVRVVREGVNQPGQRQTIRPSTQLSIQLGSQIYADALHNMGYALVKKIPSTSKGIKAGLEYSLYSKH